MLIEEVVHNELLPYYEHNFKHFSLKQLAYKKKSVQNNARNTKESIDMLESQVLEKLSEMARYQQEIEYIKLIIEKRNVREHKSK